MAHCYQLSINEREEISLGLAQGLSKNYIALSLGRSSSTICREVNRNTANRQAYRAVKAQHRANKLTHLARKSRKMDMNLPLKHYVLEKLDQLWSPEQIAKRLKILYPMDMAMQISHESIYSYLYVLPRGALRKELIKNLKWAAKKNSTNNIILHSFAHLSLSKAEPEITKLIFNNAEKRLENAGYNTWQTPFGYFLDLDLKAPGKSLARVFKEF